MQACGSDCNPDNKYYIQINEVIFCSINSPSDFIFIHCIVDVEEELLTRWIIKICFRDKRSSRKVNAYIYSLIIYLILIFVAHCSEGNPIS